MTKTRSHTESNTNTLNGISIAADSILNPRRLFPRPFRHNVLDTCLNHLAGKLAARSWARNLGDPDVMRHTASEGKKRRVSEFFPSPIHCVLSQHSVETSCDTESGWWIIFSKNTLNIVSRTSVAYLHSRNHRINIARLLLERRCDYTSNECSTSAKLECISNTQCIYMWRLLHRFPT